MRRRACWATTRDVDSDPLTAVLVDGPTHGTLVLDADGSLLYTPDANYNGSDTFSYKANDGALDSNVATVTITVAAVNDAPVAVDDAYATDEDVPLSIAAAGVLGNDTDVDGDPLTAVLVDRSRSWDVDVERQTVRSATRRTRTTTAVDTLQLQGQRRLGGLERGDRDDHGRRRSTTLRWRWTTRTATDEDVPLSVPAAGVLGNDTDVDGDPLTAVLVAGPAHGTLTLDGRRFVRVHAGRELQRQRQVHLQGQRRGLGLERGRRDDHGRGGQRRSGGGGGRVRDGRRRSAEHCGGGRAGQRHRRRRRPAARRCWSMVPLMGRWPWAADGSFSYTPDANYNGSDTFSYKANDGALDSNVAGRDDHGRGGQRRSGGGGGRYATDEDVPLSIAAAGVLGNDTDVDGDPLTAVLVMVPLMGRWPWAADGSFVYTPDANYNGTDTFSYKANDGALDSNVAVVTITVTAVNDAPVAVEDAYATDEDVPLSIAAAGVLGNDTDVEGDPLTAVLVDGPAHGTLALDADGSFSYTPDANYNGSDSVQLQGQRRGLGFERGDRDDHGRRRSMTLRWRWTTRTATDEDAPLSVAAAGVLGNDTDVEGDPLTAVLVDGPAHGTLALGADGSFELHPGRELQRYRHVHLQGERWGLGLERGGRDDHGRGGE